MLLFWFSYIYQHKLVMHSIQYSTWQGINLLFLSLYPFLMLNVLTYTLILGNIKTNGLITSSKYPIKYLELFLVSVKLKITILSTLTTQIYIFFYIIKFFFCYFSLAKSQHYYTIKKC